ncbi:TorD/DmsD family molecular chaperone [Fuchsiella alkaliacetigena]|uniref:TorD/DmsD family molecular chaperone n=1 Tax=Fuchsiella alkaliacetigena TaxID=957042 RepID=UPI00200A587B|nr:molecular chaperone TorD family protein [Fuchsiella alkaliacetigena]MCK8825011.1 molecular chaperone TorD family protein [Fuchsiella alkaliacetigena]
MKLDQILSQQKAQENIYKILSVLYHAPEESILESELLDNLIESAEFISEKLGNMAQDIKTEFVSTENFQDLKVDHSKLFVGPFELLAPPYGSVYLEKEGTVMGDSTMNVINTYKELGLDRSDDFKEPHDHIIAELEFLYYLTFNSIKETGNENYKEALEYLEAHQNFLAKHLAAWVSDFAAKIKEHANTELYKKLAELTESFIKDEVDDILEQSISKVQELIND